MKRGRKFGPVMLALLALFHLTFLQDLSAQSLSSRLPTTEDFRAAILKLSQQRQKDVEDIRSFLRQDIVHQNFSAVIDLEKLEVKVAALDDETLAELARESRIANEQIQGGVSNVVLILLVVALIILIVALATSEPST